MKGRLAVAVCLIVGVLMPAPVAAHGSTTGPAVPTASAPPATAPVQAAAQTLQATCSSGSPAAEAGPVGTIAIDGGAKTTASARVELSLPAMDECARVTTVRLSNDGELWQTLAYESTVSWSLVDPWTGAASAASGSERGGSGASGPRTVWAQWGDSEGRWSSIVTASIQFSRATPGAAKPAVVGYSIKGTVKYGSGPLPGIAVYALTEGDYFTANTDANGAYSIDALAPGSYTIWFDDPNGIYLPGYYSSTGFTYDGAQATLVIVTSADVAGIDATMPLADHIAGKVMITTGAGLSNMLVEAISDTFDYGISTGPDGSYSIPVPSGSFIIRVEDWAGHVYPTGYYDSGSSSGFTTDLASATPVLVIVGDVTGIDIRIPTGTAISGTVFGPKAPLANVTVALKSGDGSVTSVVTGADGKYTFDVTPGIYDLEVTPDASHLWGCYTTLLVWHFTYSKGACSYLQVAQPGLSGVNIDIPNANHITGTVTDASHNPVANIGVIATFGEIRLVGWTGADGTYSIPVPPGDYTVSFWDGTGTYPYGYYDGTPTGFTTNAALASKVVVVSGTEDGIDAQLTPGFHISGSVTDPTGTVFLENIGVVAVSPGFSAGVYTDMSGEFSFTVPPGSYYLGFLDLTGRYLWVYYTAGGVTTDVTQAETITITDSDQTGINRQLIESRLIQGCVGAAGIEVRAVGGPYAGLARTDSSDCYWMAVPAGSYLITFGGGSGYESGYYSASGFTQDQSHASSVTVGASDVSGIDATIPPYGKVKRLSGAGRFATAAAISAATYTPGVAVAYVAYAYNFPDALAGAAAAGTRPGPVLLVDTTGSLNPATAAELHRLQPQEIAVLGSAGVISEAVATSLVPYATTGKVTRLAGSGRFATAAAISAATFSPGVPIAYIAYAYNFPDALAGAAAAGTIKGPVLLANTTGPLDAATATELTRLKPYRIAVLGSSGVISDSVRTQLAAYARSGLVTRLSGSGRFATAAAISAATYRPGVPVAYVAYAYNFPDALAGAAAAGTIQGPVLLVNTTGTINASTAAELTRLKPHRIVVLGSAGVISASVATQLAAYAVP
jgi:putative cell wall-binding protein